MRAIVFHEQHQPLRSEDRDPPQPAQGEVVVSIKAAALNRRDYWITQGLYPGIRSGVIQGSDGAGVVAELGPGVGEDWRGKEVVINPGLGWGDSTEAQSEDFHILGMPRDGTFAEQVAVPVEQLAAKPEHLSWHEAAALPLAGLTAYRAVMTQGRLQPGERVLVTGIGGGVATMALQIALAAGAEGLVSSSSPEKLKRAAELGAAGGFNYREEGWAKRVSNEHGPVNLIIDSAGGDGYADLIDLAAPAGRIVSYGATAGGPKKLDLFRVFWKQLHLIGSTMGSPADFRAMLELVDRHGIKPVVDEVLPLSEANSAVERLAESSQFGKIVLEVAGES